MLMKHIFSVIAYRACVTPVCAGTEAPVLSSKIAEKAEITAVAFSADETLTAVYLKQTVNNTDRCLYFE